MQLLLQDLRFALRALGKTPVFSTIAILSLALGIGANTAIFTLMDQLLLRYLPVKNPEQLVMLDQPTITSGSVLIDRSFSYPMYKDFRDQHSRWQRSRSGRRRSQPDTFQPRARRGWIRWWRSDTSESVDDAVDPEIHHLIDGQILHAARLKPLNEVGAHAVNPHGDQLIDGWVVVAQ